MTEKLRNVELREGTTDYLAVNSPRVAEIMKGSWKTARQPREFRSGTERLGKLWWLLWFMARSIGWRIPLKKTDGDVIKFKQPSRVMIQAEGESEELTEVKKIEVQKARRPLKIVKF